MLTRGFFYPVNVLIENTEARHLSYIHSSLSFVLISALRPVLSSELFSQSLLLFLVSFFLLSLPSFILRLLPTSLSAVFLVRLPSLLLFFFADCPHIHSSTLACSLMAVAGVLPGAWTERPGLSFLKALASAPQQLSPLRNGLSFKTLCHWKTSKLVFTLLSLHTQREIHIQERWLSPSPGLILASGVRRAVLAGCLIWCSFISKQRK